MKNLYFFPIILLSVLIAATVHYIEYQSHQPKLDDFCPNNIPCYNDYEKGLLVAKNFEKPAILMFSGWACVNCQRWIETLYKHPPIMKLIQEEFVLIVLNVDDRTLLPKAVDYIGLNGKKRELKRTGDRWSVLQFDCYDGNHQPQFFLLNAEKQLLINRAFSYHPSLEEFASFLEEGLNNFQNGVSWKAVKCSL